jgi:hypothetical protein
MSDKSRANTALVRSPHACRRRMRALAGLAAAASLAACDGSIGSRQGYEPEQPIAYSHALHAGDLKMDCLYCHFGAEKSRHAGVPPASVCMNCHTRVLPDSPEVQKIRAAIDTGRPIAWTKVHRLPDFAYFNHARHVSAGVLCQSCHGPVETMVRVRQVETMSMGWCLDCHRNPPQGPGGTTLSPPTDCAACHQ